MSTNVSLWMPAICLRCMLSIILLLCVSNLWRVFSKCSFRRHSAYFHSGLYPSFRKKSAKFSANYPLTTFRIPQKYPFTGYRQSASTTDTRLAAVGKMASAYVCAMAHSSSDNSAIHYVTYFLLVLWMTSWFHLIGHEQMYTSLFTKQVAKITKKQRKR